jgi:flagellar motor component MotA
VLKLKKLFLILLAVLGLMVTVFAEKGTILPLLTGSVIIPLCLGIILTTMFSYHFKDIVNTFRLAFSDEVNLTKIRDYRKNLLIVKNLQSAAIFWACTILVLAVIQILSDISTPEKLGPSVAAALSALFYGFVLRAALFIPMEHNLNQKIFLSEDK